jgi:hypothetical protein
MEVFKRHYPILYATTCKIKVIFWLIQSLTRIMRYHQLPLPILCIIVKLCSYLQNDNGDGTHRKLRVFQQGLAIEKNIIVIVKVLCNQNCHSKCQSEPLMFVVTLFYL